MLVVAGGGDCAWGAVPYVAAAWCLLVVNSGWYTATPPPITVQSTVWYSIPHYCTVVFTDPTITHRITGPTPRQEKIPGVVQRHQVFMLFKC